MKQLIHGGRLLTAGRLDGALADLLIDGDTIVAVLQPGENVGDDVRRIDARDRLLIPGLVNAHTHAANQLNKGMVDRYSLELLLSAAPWTGGGRTVETNTFRPTSGRSRWCAKAARPAMTLPPKSRRRRLTASRLWRVPTTMSACARSSRR